MSNSIIPPKIDIAGTTATQPVKSPQATSAGEARAREAADSFEAMFISQMLEHMSSGLKPDDTFGGGQAESIHRSMLNEEYAKQIVKRGGIGVSESIFREMLRMQEAK